MKEMKNTQILQEPVQHEREKALLPRNYFTRTSSLHVTQKLVTNWDEPKLNRRHSFDDNGGGYAGL